MSGAVARAAGARGAGRAVIAAWIACALAAPARAEVPRGRGGASGGDGAVVALLSLDAEPRLGIYGHAVASEIGRALVAGGVTVAVVGPTADVPPSARLILDGTLSVEQGAVAVAIRLRDPQDGTVLDTLAASAPSLAQLDAAAAALAVRVLPVVRSRMAALEAARARRGPAPAAQPAPAAAPTRRPVLLSTAAPGPRQEPLRAALAAAAPRSLAGADVGAVREVPAAELARAAAPQQVARAGAARALALEVVAYAPAEARGIPVATARVRVRIADAERVVFERVVVTDTVVGERGMAPAALAARVAAEVLAILRPHARRAVAAWP